MKLILLSMVTNKQNTSGKRKKDDLSPDVVDDNPIMIGSPTFFVITCTEESATLTNVSPFLISRVIKQKVGNVKSVKKLRNGTLLVETQTAGQAVKLLSLTELDTIPVCVTQHQQLNYCKGVISCFDLLHVSEEECLQELQSQGVTALKRLTTKRTGTVSPTPALLLTFILPQLPEYVYAGIHRCKVRPFIPDPLRCYNCQKFGHTSSKCQSGKICPFCGEDAHETSECNRPRKCVNCNGDHPAFFRSCPRFQTEKKVQEIKIINRIPLPEARRLYRETNPVNKKSFADAVRAPAVMVTMATQTDCLPALPPLIKLAPLPRVPNKQTASTSTSTNTSRPIGPRYSKPSTTQIQPRNSKCHNPPKPTKFSEDVEDLMDCISDTEPEYRTSQHKLNQQHS